MILDWFKKQREIRDRRHRLLVLLVVGVLPRPGLVEICGATGLPSGVVGPLLAKLERDGLITPAPGLPPVDGCKPRMFFSTTAAAHPEAERLADQLCRSLY